MPLEPLGHKDPLLPPSSLGQSFQPQKSLLPLGQSLTPLGQHLQSPLPNASFPGTEIPTSMSSFSEPMGANAAFADRTTARITSESNRETQPSVSSAPIGDIPNLGSNSFESQAGNPPTVSGRWQEDEFAPDASNTPSFSSPNTAAENLVSRKPLGLSKPLAQESDFLTSSFTAEFLEQPRTSSQQIATASPETPVSKPLVVQGRLETQLPPDPPTTAVEIAKPSVEPVSSNSEAIASPPLPTGSERTSEASTSSKSTIVQPSLETKTPSPTNLAFSSSLTEASREDSGASLPQSAPEVPESRPSQATVVQPRLETETPAPTNLAATSSPTEISTQQSEAPAPPSAPQVPKPKPSAVTDSQPAVVQPRLETETPAPINLAATSSPTEISAQESEAPTPQSAPEVPESRPSQATDSQLTVVQPRLETETAAPINLAATSSPTETSTQESEAPSPQPAPEVSESRPQAAAPSQPTVIQPQLETETAAPTATFEPAALQGEASSQQRQASTSQSVSGVSESPASEVTDSRPNVVQPHRETETSTSTPNIAPASPPIEASTQDSEAPIPPLAPQVPNSRPSEATDSQPTVVQARREAETAAPTPNIAPASPLTNTSRENSDAIAPQPAPEVPESTPPQVTDSQIAPVQPRLETETSALTTIVQPRLDKESLPLLNPLGLSKPLAQQSDFFTSGLLAEFLGKQPTSPQEIPETPSGRSSTEPAQSPDVKVPSSLSTTGSQLSRVPSAPVRDVPDSWSSLSELLGESSTATADSRSRSWEDEFASLVKMDGESSRSEAIANSQESVTLGTDNRASSPGTTPISISSPATSTQPTADKEREDSIEEQLEILAQKIYSLIRQRLEIDKERQGHYCTGHPPWLDTLDPKSSNTASPTSARSPQTAGQLTASLNGEVSSLDGKLEILTQEVYNLLRLRLEIERERQNIYY